MADAATIAHLLKRTTFGPRPGQVENLLDVDLATIVDDIIEADAHLDVPEVDDDYGELESWWLGRMRAPDAGLHEKLTWFWHGHFTTSMEKAAAPMVAGQHRTVREHALGNFRTLAKAIVIDPAMLVYLDGDGSPGSNPNENLARELMELFTIGRGNYAEADVKAAARALSGWWVDWDQATAHFEREDAYLGAVRFLGADGRFTPEDIVDRLCDHAACAPFVAAKLHHYLVGTWPTEDHLAELAATFAGGSLEIAPLVEAIVRDDSFLAARGTRPKYAVEWYVGATGALGIAEGSESDLWHLELLGQVPFNPPNVAGWPAGERWISPSQALTKANLLVDMEPEQPLVLDQSDAVGDALARCGLYQVSAATREVLEEAWWAPLDQRTVDHLLVVLALNTPEFALA